MKSIHNITLIGMFVALLIASQYVLSFVSGVEIVTVLLLCISYVFGKSKGVIVATAFSLIRCFVFGFNINVIILYLVYYNFFAWYFGLLGTKTKNVFVITLSAVLFTLLFTMLDNIISPLILGFNKKAFLAYMFSSLYTMVPHLVCTAVTVILLFNPLTRVLHKLKNS